VVRPPRRSRCHPTASPTRRADRAPQAPTGLVLVPAGLRPARRPAGDCGRPASPPPPVCNIARPSRPTADQGTDVDVAIYSPLGPNPAPRVNASRTMPRVPPHHARSAPPIGRHTLLARDPARGFLQRLEGRYQMHPHTDTQGRRKPPEVSSRQDPRHPPAGSDQVEQYRSPGLERELILLASPPDGPAAAPATRPPPHRGNSRCLRRAGIATSDSTSPPFPSFFPLPPDLAATPRPRTSRAAPLPARPTAQPATLASPRTTTARSTAQRASPARFRAEDRHRVRVVVRGRSSSPRQRLSARDAMRGNPHW